MNKKENKYSFRRALLEWLGIGAVIAVLYFTGLHTPVQGALQQAVLWTGLYDADHTEGSVTDGPILTTEDFSFSLTSAQGEQIKLQKFKGNVLFINVWASWCPPCIAEMPAIQKLYNSLKSNPNIRFILISKDRDKTKAIEFMKNRDFSMPWYFPLRQLPQELQSPVIPSTFIVSKKGQVVYRKEGLANYNSDAFKEWLITLSH